MYFKFWQMAKWISRYTNTNMSWITCQILFMILLHHHSPRFIYSTCINNVKGMKQQAKVLLGLQRRMEVIECSEGVWSCWEDWAGQAGPERIKLLSYTANCYMLCIFFWAHYNANFQCGKQTSETEVNLGTPVTEMSHHVKPAYIIRSPA